MVFMLQQRLSCPLVFHHLKLTSLPINNNDMLIPESWPFAVKYMIDAILCHGAVGKKVLAGVASNFENFVAKIRNFGAASDETLAFLTEVYYKILIYDKQLTFVNYQDLKLKQCKNIVDKNYVSMRRVVITPTRRIFYPPEPTMGCRIIRELGADKFLRVVFREETMDVPYSLSDEIIDDFIIEPMRNSLTVGGERFYYLGYSNSQLRDKGCYFYKCDDLQELPKIYQFIGEFNDDGVSKTMARFAQGFTQSIVSVSKKLASLRSFFFVFNRNWH